MKTITPLTTNSISRSSRHRGTVAALLNALALAWFALSPALRAQECREGCEIGFDNTFLGEDALAPNSTGTGNTAIGSVALQHNTTGNYNTAIGFQTLLGNTIGSFNMANGVQALQNNTTGSFNTANGVEALFGNTTGSNNTATGFEALFSTTGNNNIALGFQAGISVGTGSHNIEIGNRGVPDESNNIRIGSRRVHTNTFIAGISGVAVAGGVGVIIDARGHLGTVVSSERLKDNAQPMDKASEAILALKPVTFRYKKELDADGIPQFGLVAEEVEKVNPDLVARDDHGKPYTVRYEAVNAMLLNEFLKEHRKNEQQEAKIARQQKQIDALTAGLQKVSAQLEASKPASQTVSNNH